MQVASFYRAFVCRLSVIPTGACTGRYGCSKLPVVDEETSKSKSLGNRPEVSELERGLKAGVI